MTKKILIIDDDLDLSREMADILKDEGHVVDVRLFDLKDRRHFKAHEYEIIVLDFKMPGITGLDILKWIPDTGLTPKVFVITGKPFVEKFLSDERLLGKVTEIISKPFSIQSLLDKINVA